jgi:hypothetical protein
MEEEKLLTSPVLFLNVTKILKKVSAGSSPEDIGPIYHTIIS